MEIDRVTEKFPYGNRELDIRPNKILEILGDGDNAVGRRFLNLLASHVEHARKKHPKFADDMGGGLTHLFSEMVEIEDAFETEGECRTLDEAFDAAAVIVRLFNREWLGGTSK